MIHLPPTRFDKRAPTCAPRTTPTASIAVLRTPCSKAPLAMCTNVPVKAITAKTKCDVAVAICTGKFNKRLSAGTWMKPPPTPKRLEIKPTNILSTMPTTGL